MVVSYLFLLPRVLNQLLWRVRQGNLGQVLGGPDPFSDSPAIATSACRATARLSMIVVIFSVMCVDALRADLLATAALEDSSSNTYTFSITNQELVGSPNFLSGFTLTPTVPYAVLGTPNGWSVSDFDGVIFWFNQELWPYPHDVAPGLSLSSFVIHTTIPLSGLISYEISSWDHVADTFGPTTSSVVVVPEPTPEPSTWAMVAAPLLVLGAYKRFHFYSRTDCRSASGLSLSNR